jgi:hypothetical protein
MKNKIEWAFAGFIVVVYTVLCVSATIFIVSF